MSWTINNVVESPYKLLGTLPESAPSRTTRGHGRVPMSGMVSVEVDGACNVDIYVRSLGSGEYRHPGSNSGSYQKTFSEAAYDFFVAPVGAEYFIVASTSGITSWHSGDDV